MDEAIHLTLGDGQARVILLETTALVQQAADIHHCSPVATAALGRLMTGTLMLGLMLKGVRESVTVNVRGDGPLSPMVAVAQGGHVKAYASNPQVDLPLRPDGKLDVGGAVGRHGRMSVVKNLGLKEPYVGQMALVSGELGEDFAHYFTVSEQTPSLVALGVRVHEQQVLKAGGLLIQAMPGCTDEMLDQLELRSPMFADISYELCTDDRDSLLHNWFDGLSPKELSRVPLSFQCNCSYERMEKALLSLGEKDLAEMVADGGGAELACHFCGKKYTFPPEALQTMIDQGKKPHTPEK